MGKVAVGQLCSSASMADNLLLCKTIVSKAVAAGAEVLFLPEATDYIASSAAESVSLAVPVSENPLVVGLQEEARTANMAINVGIHEPVTEPANKVKNTLIWIDASGHITHRYEKLHLFDVDISDGPVARESLSVQEGGGVEPPLSTVLGMVGMMICFDLRFPEVSLALRRQGAEIMTYPSAFTVPTGKAHWEPLLRARAIETQAYVIAAAQAGSHNEKRTSYGHSMVISPWGEVVASLDDTAGPQIIVVDIDVGNEADAFSTKIGRVSGDLNGYVCKGLDV